MGKILNIHTESIISEILPISLDITTVLVEGIVGDYAAYKGHGTPEWIASHGNKISYREARRCFAIVEENYRG